MPKILTMMVSGALLGAFAMGFKLSVHHAPKTTLAVVGTIAAIAITLAFVYS